MKTWELSIHRWNWIRSSREQRKEKSEDKFQHLEAVWRTQPRTRSYVIPFLFSPQSIFQCQRTLQPLPSFLKSSAIDFHAFGFPSASLAISCHQFCWLPLFFLTSKCSKCPCIYVSGHHCKALFSVYVLSVS